MSLLVPMLAHGRSKGDTDPIARRETSAAVVAESVVKAIKDEAAFTPPCPDDDGCRVMVGARLGTATEFGDAFDRCIEDSFLDDLYRVLPREPIRRPKRPGIPSSPEMDVYVFVTKQNIENTIPLEREGEHSDGTEGLPQWARPDLMLNISAVRVTHPNDTYRLYSASIRSGSTAHRNASSQASQKQGTELHHHDAVPLPELYLSDFVECQPQVEASLDFELRRGTGPALPSPIETATAGDQIKPIVSVRGESYVYLFMHVGEASRGGIGPVTLPIPKSLRNSRSVHDDLSQITVPDVIGEATFHLLVTADEVSLPEELQGAIRQGAYLSADHLATLLRTFVAEDPTARALHTTSISFN